MNNKKALATLEILGISIIITVLLSSFMIYLFLASEIPQRNSEDKQKILFSTLTSANCLFTKNHEINLSAFNQSFLDKCISDYEFDTHGRIALLYENKTLIKETDILYIGEKEKFSNLKQFCGISSSQLCSSQILLPVGDVNRAFLSIELITEK